MKTLLLDAALAMVQAALQYAGAEGAPLAVAVLDDRLQLKAFAANDSATRLGVEIAQSKAYTAVMTGMSSALWAEKVHARPEFWMSVIARSDGRLIAGRGGVPIVSGGTVVGGLGIAGPSGDFDEACAQFALGAFAPGRGE